MCLNGIFCCFLQVIRGTQSHIFVQVLKKEKMLKFKDATQGESRNIEQINQEIIIFGLRTVVEWKVSPYIVKFF